MMRTELPTNQTTDRYNIRKIKKEHKNTSTIYICTKCGEMYDYYLNYNKEKYSIPRYGKQVKGLCHQCRSGSVNYMPKKGSLTEIMLSCMLKDNLEITSLDYTRFGFASVTGYRSTLSILVSRNVLKARKVKGQTFYTLTNEYKEKLNEVTK